MIDREQSDRDDFDRDDQLRALLRSGDPAAALRPADPGAVSRLVDDVVRVAGAGDVAAIREPSAARRRGPLTWLAGAAAAAVVLTAGVGAVHQAADRDRSGTPTARSAAPTSSAAPSTSSGASSAAPTTGAAPVDTLTVSEAAFEGRCAAVNAPMLAANQIAFAGTVTGIDGRRVTLRTDTVLRGAVADSVSVRAPAADFGWLIQTVRFKVGSDYLISATDGQVSLCGFSGPATASLQRLYTEAFSR